jgi:hypothetical protein
VLAVVLDRSGNPSKLLPVNSTTAILAGGKAALACET